MNPEQATVRAFIVRPRQGLYLALLSDVKGRGHFLDRLLSGRDIDPAALAPFADDERKPNQIAERLRKLGGPDDCHVISADSALDGRESKLDDALRKICGKGKPALISCVAGRLAYFEGADGDPVLLRAGGARKSSRD
ncbi:MAG: hypothetical protein WD118_11650 [Phycisphaeraceae bacterium]